MGRLLGIDFGSKRLGLARSDAKKIIALPYRTLFASKTLEQTADLLMLELEDIEGIIMGLPLLLSGKESETSLVVREFSEILKKKSLLPITLWDERLSSKQVEKLMIEDHVKRKKREKHLDSLSATLILQSYLDHSRACF